MLSGEGCVALGALVLLLGFFGYVAYHDLVLVPRWIKKQGGFVDAEGKVHWVKPKTVPEKVPEPEPAESRVRVVRFKRRLLR